MIPKTGGGSAHKSHTTPLQTTVNPTPFRPRGGDPKGGFFRWLLGRVTAGRGVEKVEPGSEKILGVGLNFKIRICPAHSRSDVGLEKLRALCEAYVKSIKRDHNKIHIWSSKPRRCICAASTEHKETSMNDESIDAENRANEITD